MRQSTRAARSSFRCLGLATTLLLATGWLGGCRSQDPVGMRVVLDEDRTGTISVSALSMPEIARIEASDTAGVDWEDAARLTLTSGTFSDVDGLRFVDVTFDAADLSAGAGTLRVTFPRGDRARWFRALHARASERAALKKTLAGAVSEVELHENVTISIRVSDARVAAGLVTPVPRITVSAKDDVATLIAPLAVLESEAPSLVLVVNWERTEPDTTD